MWNRPIQHLESALLLYLACATEGVHVIEDWDELPVKSWVQDVAIDFEVLNHYIHHPSAQLQGYYVRPLDLSSL